MDSGSAILFYTEPLNSVKILDLTLYVLAAILINYNGSEDNTKEYSRPRCFSIENTKSYSSSKRFCLRGTDSLTFVIINSCILLVKELYVTASNKYIRDPIMVSCR